MKKFKKVVAFIFALCVIGASVPAMAAENESSEIQPRFICEVVVDEGSYLNLRSGPSTSYSVLAKLPNGTVVTNSYLGNQGPYPDEGYFTYVTAHLKSGKVKGYVDYRYIDCMA